MQLEHLYTANQMWKAYICGYCYGIITVLLIFFFKWVGSIPNKPNPPSKSIIIIGKKKS